MDQIEAFERAGYRMSGYNKRQTEARVMRAERKVCNFFFSWKTRTEHIDDK